MPARKVVTRRSRVPSGASRLRIGISSCLLGEKVRWDGGHKRDRYVTGILGRYFEWIPVCPELEVGMGVPREPVRLEGRPSSPRMVGVKSGEDWTDRMTRYAGDRIRRLEKLDLSGYLLKSDSPSCGMERLRVYPAKGKSSRRGIGFFARQLRQALPLLPVEEERRLHDPKLRENFIERVFAFRRLRDLMASGCRRRDLLAFHAAHKFQILSHSPRHFQVMDRLVTSAKGHPTRVLARLYSEAFMAALRIPANAQSHCKVLRHVAELLNGRLDAREKRELQEVLQGYRKGLVPLVVPLNLLKHHLARHDVDDVHDPIYLNPHPEDLMLGNHV